MTLIENLDELKKEAIRLISDKDEDLASAMENVSSAYLKGITDEVESHLRRAHLSAFGFDNYAELFPKSEPEIEECHKIAEAMKRAPIEKRLADEAEQKAKRAEYGEESEYEVKTKGQKPKRKRFSLSRLERKIGAEKCIVSPRSYNYIRLKNKKGEGEIFLPDFSNKAEAIIDLLFDEIAKNLAYGTKGEGEAITAEMIDAVIKNPKDFPSEFGIISFATSEIRKRLNVTKRWTDKEIVKAAEELREKGIRATGVKIFADADGKYRKGIDWLGSICSDVLTEKTDKIAPKTKNIQHEVHCVMGLISGLLFSNDALRQRFSLLPTDSPKLPHGSFYRMKTQVKKLYKYLSLWDYTVLTIPMARDILGYSEKTDISQIRERVTGYLNEMAEADLIKGWMRPCDKKGLETMWAVGVNISPLDMIREEK